MGGLSERFAGPARLWKFELSSNPGHSLEYFEVALRVLLWNGLSWFRRWGCATFLLSDRASQDWISRREV